MSAPVASGQKWLRVRLGIAVAVLTGLFGTLAYKAWGLQIRDGARMQELGLEQVLKELIIPAPRGTIRDTNGVELAVSVDVPSAFVNPREVIDVADTAGKLAPLIGMDVRDLEEKLASPRRFEWLKRRLSPDEAKKIAEVLPMPGIGLVAEPRRFYPMRDLLGPVLGFANVDGKGIEGLELSLEERLRGTRAKLPAIRDRRGDLVVASDLDPRGDGTPAIPGQSVTLTIDRTIQFITERALAEGVQKNKAKAGIAIVMDPRNGEVLAMASYPNYDPNDADAKDPLAHNRAVNDAYEPGSVMKVFSVAAALEAGVVNPETMIDTGGGLAVGKFHITDAHQHGAITATEVIKFSSNIGAGKIARMLGAEKLAGQYALFGFGTRTGIELPGETAGRVKNAAHWDDATLVTSSYGYGMSASPLQLTTAATAIANGGILYQPSIIRRIVDGEGQVTYQHPTSARRVLSATTSKQMVAMMKTVLDKGGTANTDGLGKVRVPGFVIAGKTGTAYKHDAHTHQYAKDRYLGSFIGIAPADNARLVILVQIDEPSAGQHYGGDVAAPVVAAIAGESLKYLGVAGDPNASVEPTAVAAKPAKPGKVVVAAEAPPEVEEGLPEDLDIPGLEDVDAPEAGPGENIVRIPDFKGLSVAQALGAARTAGVKIEIEGSGRAVQQFPPPGRVLKSITCHVTFSPG